MSDKVNQSTNSKKNVQITINSEQFEIHRGRQSVVEIKTLGSVALADELNQLINGVLTLLPDDGAVTIKGDEIFVSQPPSGAAS